MKLISAKRAPVFIVLAAVVLVLVVHWLELPLLEDWEHRTFDFRVRTSAASTQAGKTPLRFVYIDDATIRAVKDGSLGYRFGLYWPRQIYGRLIEQLKSMGVKAVALDVIFGELRPDHPPVEMQDGSLLESDEYFGLAMRQASNVVLAITEEVVPPPLFLTNAAAHADIYTEKDSDGILRRAKAFREIRHWHSLFRQLHDDPEYGVDLARAVVQPGQIRLPRPAGLDDIIIPLDQEGQFAVADFAGGNLPADFPRFAKPFQVQRIWHMGIVLASIELGLDLDTAEIDFHEGKIRLRGRLGVERNIPVDKNGFFYIDWALPVGDHRLAAIPAHALLLAHRDRLEGSDKSTSRDWADTLVVIGSSAMGNDLTDRGATPLNPSTLLVSKHWNVANSVINNRFVHRSGRTMDGAILIILAVIGGTATWRLKAVQGSVVVIACSVVYIAVTFWIYQAWLLWLPVVMPVLGSLFATHICLATWKATFEEADKQKVRAVFSTIVSPKIVQELLAAEVISFGGARRELTVMFADVRGFTELTDASLERAVAHIKQNSLSGEAAERCFDAQALDTLNTINLYLGVVSDTVITHDGTHDKFIGDCVMAFWGAPSPRPGHAVACVRAAIDAQRAIHRLNMERSEENERRVLQNKTRPANGMEPLPMLPILSLGTGINTGPMIVGLLGSDGRHRFRQGSYTVFGREVNLAQRLESLSGRGHIFISENTYQHLCRDAPALAATCVRLAPLPVKGIKTAVQVYEVAWDAVANPDQPLQPSAGAPLADTSGAL